jgi:L-lactate dehydrogenase complex protein LldG
MNRDEFLARVRAAAAAGRAFRVHPAHNDDAASPAAATVEDLAVRMTAEVNAVGGHGVLVETLADARFALDALLRRNAPRSALCWHHPLLERLGLAELLAAQSIEPLDYTGLARLDPAVQREQCLAAGIGITSATLAVAETGTLVMVAEPGRERIASLLPPVHVALITAEQIRPDLFAVFRELESSGFDRLSSNITLITGPSKTGDLELRLTTGVHGPGHGHVIVIRQA